MSDTPRLTPKSSSLSGWRAPQNIRWALRNFSILPSMMVPRGETTYQLEKGRQFDVESFTYDFQGQQVRLGDAMQADSMDGYIVIKDNEIIFEKLKERAGEIDTVHRELSKEIQQVEKKLLLEIRQMKLDLGARVSIIEKYRWLIMGGALVIGWILSTNFKTIVEMMS